MSECYSNCSKEGSCKSRARRTKPKMGKTRFFNKPARRERSVPTQCVPALAPSTPAQRESFTPYITREEAIEGVMSGKYVRGTVAINKKYSSAICFVRNAKQWNDVDILIEGKTDRNRAFNGDVVIVEIKPEEEWKSKDKEKPTNHDAAAVTSVHIRSREEDMKLPKDQRSKLPDNRPVCRALAVLQSRNKQAEEDPLADAPKPNLSKDMLITGRIVHIWKQDHQTKHVARALGPAERKTWIRFASYDDKYPHIEVHRNDLKEFQPLLENTEGFLVYLELMREWGDKRFFPQARILKLLGAADQVEVESRAILVQNGTDYTDEFDEECMKVIPDKVPIPSEAELLKEGRRDMRLGAKHERFVCTIDPATARDLDDALSCHDLGGGHYRVSVHIADVCTFVPFGSALDQEALKRATSVYLVQKVIPMLPRKLCEEHCSLNTLGDKLAFTVEWVMDAKGNITSEWMGQTVIRNQCKLAYENAQSIIDGNFDPNSIDLAHISPSRRAWTVERIKESVKGLWKIAEHIRAARHARGALSLNQAKMYFDFEDYNSNMAPKGWHMHETAEANWLVEEFMVLANARVTEKCIEYCPEVSLARYHSPPDASRFESLIKALGEQGLKLNVGSGKALSTSLDNISKHPQIEAIRALTIRCMMLAKYCCTSESADHSLSHFALNLPLYTHFTSPIRRYADLVVHRVLKVALEIEALVKRKLREGVAEEDIVVTPDDVPSGYLLLPEADVTEIALRCNTRKEEARKASDQSIVLYYCLYLQSLYKRWEADGRTEYKERHKATLTKVQEKSFNIFVESLGLDRELFHDNGHKDQRWLGTNKKNAKQGSMCIQWEEGLFEEASVLHRWDVLVWYKKESKNLDFVCQICPPDRSELVGEVGADLA
eukprot:TRINITY_DN516_c0_g1_i4.p1 TRINITY_DN516_c0_g1~~TRINITY_DN516_c0_g1_i4.p1  ORF type:complete len:890 (+),score=377.81 TRINITY_DN516_c0_g1_i4:68-2737(+)